MLYRSLDQKKASSKMVKQTFEDTQCKQLYLFIYLGPAALIWSLTAPNFRKFSLKLSANS